jgi:salicylate biosynthesis isochorismate synthase
MIAGLRRQLGDPALPARMHALAAGAPASAPVSLTLELGPGTPDWLATLPASGPFWYQARPAQGSFRLGLGHALHVISSGGQRFASLASAFAGFAGTWRRNGTPLAFCGFAFDERSQGPLPNALLAIPAVLLERTGGRCRATLTTTAAQIDQAPALWRELLARPAPDNDWRLLPSADRTLAERAWIARAGAALRAIAGGRAAKIVLARSRRLQADRPLPVRRLLANLVEQQPESTVFAFASGLATFLGATPECLVRLAAGEVHADALAGTAWPGSPALDAAKNRHEQALVVDAIVAALAGCCAEPPQPGAPGVHTAGPVAHLRSVVSGRTAPGATLFDLVRALHPTPAVGGFPAAAALAWLAAHEERRSGWYSGGFGSLAPDGDGDVSVALRSALIAGDTIELQAGAGIVAGSDPTQELAETEAKFATLLAALNARAEPSRHSLC